MPLINIITFAPILLNSRAAATSKMEYFVIIVNGFQPLTIITKCSILDVAAALDPPLTIELSAKNHVFCICCKSEMMIIGENNK